MLKLSIKKLEERKALSMTQEFPFKAWKCMDIVFDMPTFVPAQKCHIPLKGGVVNGAKRSDSAF